MCQLTLSVPDATSEALHIPAERLGAELLLAAALKLHESGRLSSGAAAELAGLPKPVFLEQLAIYGVPAFQQSPAELQGEMTNA
jgi:predicted HTH domain antitoxin